MLKNFFKTIISFVRNFKQRKILLTLLIVMIVLFLGKHKISFRPILRKNYGFSKVSSEN